MLSIQPNNSCLLKLSLWAPYYLTLSESLPYGERMRTVWPASFPHSCFSTKYISLSLRAFPLTTVNLLSFLLAYFMEISPLHSFLLFLVSAFTPCLPLPNQAFSFKPFLFPFSLYHCWRCSVWRHSSLQSLLSSQVQTLPLLCLPLAVFPAHSLWYLFWCRRYSTEGNEGEWRGWQ